MLQIEVAVKQIYSKNCKLAHIMLRFEKGILKL